MRRCRPNIRQPYANGHGKWARRSRSRTGKADTNDAYDTTHCLDHSFDAPERSPSAAREF